MNNQSKMRLLEAIARLSKNITNLYGKAYLEALGLEAVKAAISALDETFSFDDHPSDGKKLQKILDRLAKDTAAAIIQSSLQQVEDAFLNSWKDIVSGVDDGEKSTIEAVNELRNISEQEHREKAVKTQKQRGLDISKRVWSYNEQSKREIEIMVQNGIKQGKGAEDMAGELKQYLNRPDTLFRRVRDKDGNLTLSKAAKEYHPGQGVYRSAHKNALRLARTEVNMAYRQAEWQSYQDNPLVKAYEIRLSNNHTTTNSKGEAVALFDICDLLAGVYPTWFRWVGWHPQCRCAMIPIVLSPQEFGEYKRAKRDGKLDEWLANRPQVGLPSNFTDWMEANEDKIEVMRFNRKMPYFLRDNEDRLFGNGNDDIEYTNAELSQISYGRRINAMLSDIDGLDSKQLKKALENGTPQEIEDAARELSKQGKELYKLRYLDDPIKVAKELGVDGAKEMDTKVKDTAFAWGVDKFRGKEVIDKAKASIAQLEAKKERENISDFYIEGLKKSISNAELRGRFKAMDKLYDSLYDKEEDEFMTEKYYELFDIFVEEIMKSKNMKNIDALEQAAANLEQEYQLRIDTDYFIRQASVYETTNDEFDKLLGTLRKLHNEHGSKSDIDDVTNKMRSIITSIVKERNSANGYKRKSLGDLAMELGDDMPETLKHLADGISRYEQMDLYGRFERDNADKIEKQYRELFEQNDYGMWVQDNVLQSILDDGVFKNQFETGTSGGYLGSQITEGKIQERNLRLQMSHGAFMNRRDLDDQLGRDEYEKYGCLLDADIAKSMKDYSEYGNCQVRFKKDKVLATFTPDDSLDTHLQPSLCSDPKASSFDNMKSIHFTFDDDAKRNKIEKVLKEMGSPYIELQYHGKLSTDCVESITFPYNVALSANEDIRTLATKWKKIGAKIYYIANDGKLCEF